MPANQSRSKYKGPLLKPRCTPLGAVPNTGWLLLRIRESMESLYRNARQAPETELAAPDLLKSIFVVYETQLS